MLRFFALAVTMALTGCGGVSGVDYTKVNMQPLPSDATVALHIALPEGENDPFWHTAERKLRSKLGATLKGEQLFAEVVNPGEPADYDLRVQVADIATGSRKSDAGTSSAIDPSALQKAGDAITSVITSYADSKAPEQLRHVFAYVSLEPTDGGEDVVAFKTSGAAGQTENTVSVVMWRIIDGLQCYGEDCV